MGIYQGENLLAPVSLATVSGIDTFDATAIDDHILIGQTAYVDGQKITGTMPNQGTKTAALDAGGSYTIPEGYHNGSGKVTANSLASQTDGTATAAQILEAQTAYVDGTKVTGTMLNRSTVGTNGVVGFSSSYPTTALNPSGSDYLKMATDTAGTKRIVVRAPSGYYKEGNVYVGAPASLLGDATAADVASGKTFTSSAGLKVIGTAETKTYTTITINSTTKGKAYVKAADGTSVDVPANGSATISVSLPCYILLGMYSASFQYGWSGSITGATVTEVLTNGEHPYKFTYQLT